MTRLILWRHGNTDWNAGRPRPGPDRRAAQRPRPAAGRRRRRRCWPRCDPTRIVSSDLRRAADTAAALAALTGLPVKHDPRLRERYFGEWQGCTMAEVARRSPAEYARWRAGDRVTGCDVETLDDLGKRVADGAAGRRRRRTRAARSWWPPTAAAARQGCGHLLGWPSEQLRTLRALQNCHWTELTDAPPRGGTGWQLDGLTT